MSPPPYLEHRSLNATLVPKQCDSHCQFRGIKYALIPARFEHSIPVNDWDGKTLNCTAFGPKCPQPYRDLRPLYDLPIEQTLPPPVPEDEYECLNLVVSVPDAVLQDPDRKVPVLIYLHGGGHSYTMVNIEQGFTSPTDIIKKSLEMKKPIIMVHVAYRLNLFGYSVHNGKTNFGFHDQKRAVEWVRRHIDGFGGDPNNVTLSGQSAGGIAVHAHIHGPSPTKGIKRAIMQSGSLYLTPPQPRRVGEAIMSKLAELSGTDDSQSISSRQIVKGLGQMEFRNTWLHEEENIFAKGGKGQEWPVSDNAGLEAIMVGDCKYESRGYERHIISLGVERLEDLFETQYPEPGFEITKAYNISFDSMENAQPGVSAFINDVKFAFAADEITRVERKRGKAKCFRYMMDQPNPWDHSQGAHHALDLLFLFGGPFDYGDDEGVTEVCEDMREKWVTFVYGGCPWEEDKVMAWGPVGKRELLDPRGVMFRRRVDCFDTIRKIGWEKLQPLVTRLVEARGIVEEAYLD